MQYSKYGTLVDSARHRRGQILAKALASNSGAVASQGVWARELDLVNQHITVAPENVEKASEAYEEIAEHLVTNLKWPRDAIEIMPQGSASTQTLIKAPTNAKFDIDAVCSVDFTRVIALDPMKFFGEVGRALAAWKPDAKKRCWQVQFPNEPYYVEVTPSIPLSQVPANYRESLRFKPSDQYKNTALAVVDTPTKTWKTSNPEGFAAWVNDQAKKPLLRSLYLEKAAKSAMDANVAPVPEQNVPLSDTLRIAIRLFKRHRDMTVRRGIIDEETQPISIIIVTLLTECYQGLFENGGNYSHPIELLVDLAEMLPAMIETLNGQYWVANPTVEGENFAERWNGDGGRRKRDFDTWHRTLIEDLTGILAASDEQEVRRKVREVFGCTGATTPPSSPGGGLAPSAPTRAYAVPAGKGLA